MCAFFLPQKILISHTSTCNIKASIKHLFLKNIAFFVLFSIFSNFVSVFKIQDSISSDSKQSPGTYLGEIAFLLLCLKCIN